MGLRRRVAATAVALVAVTLAACAPALPESVVPGTHAVVGVTGEVTSSNPLASPTPANLELAAATRAGFGAMVDGEFVPDPSFGAVTISGDDPFTVRYDLAEPSWSDGTPVDAADLLLGWSWAAGILPADDADAGAEAEATDAGAQASLEPEMVGVPELDEFGRAIVVRFAEPTMLWQTAVTAQVPAHIVGRFAFGLDDAMEAKQAVVRAIEDDDAAALAKIGEAWDEGFAWGEADDPSVDLLLSSGPYRVDDVTRDATGQSVTLVPNAAYRGGAPAQVARVDLVPADADAVAEVGARLDVVQVAPTSANDAPIHQLERRDATVATTHDGTVWSLLLRPAGVLTDAAARAAFLRLAPVGDMVDRGAGPWAAAYAKTTSMLAMPGSRAFDVVAEDSGFAAALGTPADDAALDREAAGVPAGATVCVLYDRASPFAAGAFAALRDAAAEAGWTVTDCGADEIDAALAQGGWVAALARVPIPQSPAQIAEQWGSTSTTALTLQADAERDTLIAQYAHSVDVYDSRDLLAQIEATIVRAAVARPIAMNPVVTLADREVTGVAARNGPGPMLLPGIAQWSAAVDATAVAAP